jgi:hypothetical protein
MVPKVEYQWFLHSANRKENFGELALRLLLHLPHFEQLEVSEKFLIFLI